MNKAYIVMKKGYEYDDNIHKNKIKCICGENIFYRNDSCNIYKNDKCFIRGRHFFHYKNSNCNIIKIANNNNQQMKNDTKEYSAQMHTQGEASDYSHADDGEHD